MKVVAGAKLQGAEKANEHGPVVRPVCRAHDGVELLLISRAGGFELPNQIPESRFVRDRVDDIIDRAVGMIE